MTVGRSLQLRFTLIALVTVVCLYGIFGLPVSAKAMDSHVKKHIHLGLDLWGGTELVAEVHLQDAFNAEADGLINHLKDRLAAAGIPYSKISRNNPQSVATAASVEIDVDGVPAGKGPDFEDLIHSAAGPGWLLTALSTGTYRLTLSPSYATELRRDTLTETINTLSRKVNELGLSEATVQPYGQDRDAQVFIQLPGVSDPYRMRQILQTAAVLDLCEVIDGPYDSSASALGSHGGILPLDTQVVSGTGVQPSYWLLSRSPVITGRDLRDARPTQGPNGGWETEFFLTQDAARRFRSFTGSHVGKRLAIVLDKKVLSAPVIQSEIGDSGVIEGLSGEQEASELALNLRSGSLPASIGYLEEDTIGPSLGADSIREGLRAGLGALAAVILALAIYYRRAGLNAILALVLNGIIVLAALSYVGAVLTLPGIAGMILTIGMAVDSNVLIFERVREERRGGKSVLAAVDAGFRQAFRTIIDTHITTMVSCAFLFEFGPGSVRGFAVTLLIGLAANLFTAVFVSRAIFDWELSRHRRVEMLSI